MQWFMYVRVLKIYLNDQNIVVRKSRTLEDCDRLMQLDNSSFDLSGDALVLGDWLLPALGKGRCWQFGVLTAREFGLLLSCHYSSVNKDSMENSVTKPFRFDLSQSQQINLNSTKVQSFNFDLIFYVPIFLPSLSFLRIWMVQSKHGELTSEIFNLLPELWHQLSVMSWSHLLLMWSICCASDAVGHTGVLNLLRSDNLSHCHSFGYCW